MHLPKSLKKALALAGIATGLAGVTLASDKKQSDGAGAPDAIVDASKVPTTPAGTKDLSKALMDAADKVCHVKHLFFTDDVRVQLDDVNHSATVTVNCRDAHSKAHRGR